MPIYGAEMLFASGKRIPPDGAYTLWEVKPENSRFAEAANNTYDVRVFRTSTSGSAELL